MEGHCSTGQSPQWTVVPMEEEEEEYCNLEIGGMYSQKTRRDEQRRKYSKMDKRAIDKLVRSSRENGGG